MTKIEEHLLATKIESIRGMKDALPDTTPYWQALEKVCRSVAAAYAYQEIRFPLLESTHLFQRTIGEVTDIVEKEMFTFTDRDGSSITLRPEGTAGCVRTVVQNTMLRDNPIQRLWFLGPMFRYERPQKGRYRQFHQFDVEAYGMNGPEIDVEQILLCQHIWEQLGIKKLIRLEINSLGTTEDRKRYRTVFVEYFKKHFDQLDEDSKRRLSANPLRILDSKNPDMQEFIHHAPKLLDFIDEASQQKFSKFCKLLDAAHVSYRVNPHLVRGLDYYCHTVYEWVTDHLGAQGTVCAGGRYDQLVEQLGGPATPAVGFALGLERVILLLQEQHRFEFSPDIYMVLVGDAAMEKGIILAERLRKDLPNMRVETNLTNASFKSQFKRADKSQARFALILGEDELKNDKISLKSLREEMAQQNFDYHELISFLQARSMT